MDIPRLIWQLEKNHAAEIGRLQAEQRSLWRELSSLQEAHLQKPQAKVAVPVLPAAAPSLGKEVEQLRCELRRLGEQSASAERTARAAAESIGGLRDELRKCTAEAATSASAAKLAAQSCARSQNLAQEVEVAAARVDVSDSLEQRLCILEEARMYLDVPQAMSAPPKESCSAMGVQVGHLRDDAVEAEQASTLWRQHKASGAATGGTGATSMLELHACQKAELTSSHRISIDDASVAEPTVFIKSFDQEPSVPSSDSRDGRLMAPVTVAKQWHADVHRETDFQY